MNCSKRISALDSPQNAWQSRSHSPQAVPRSGGRAGEADDRRHSQARPVVVENGEEVIFATHEAPNLVAIVRLTLSDGSRRRMHPTVVNHQFDPAFSPDGHLHAYARSATSPQMVLVIQDLRDKKESVFRPRESRATVRNPSFAPDGTRVVFSLSDIGGHQISSVNKEAQDLKALDKRAAV